MGNDGGEKTQERHEEELQTHRQACQQHMTRRQHAYVGELYSGFDDLVWMCEFGGNAIKNSNNNVSDKIRLDRSELIRMIFCRSCKEAGELKTAYEVLSLLLFEL